MAGTLPGARDLKIKQCLCQQVARWDDSKESSHDHLVQSDQVMQNSITNNWFRLQAIHR